MKTIRILFIAAISILYFCTCTQEIKAQTTSEDYFTISGFVKDGNTKKNLGYINIAVVGKKINTITNGDGYFNIKIRKQVLTKKSQEFIFSGLGYKNSRITISIPQEEEITIMLKPEQNLLSEITIYPSDPRLLIQKALEKITYNYSDKPTLLTGFYRETTQKRHKYITLSEAIVESYKSSYSKSTFEDRVRIIKGRKLISPKPSDTLSVKLLGGPSLFTYLDVVKNREGILSEDLLKNYSFTMESQAIINERPQYVISFSPNQNFTDNEEFSGKIYIDKDLLAFSRVEYSLSMEDLSKATRYILYKKPSGLRFKPQELSFVVTYIHEGGKSYLNYISSTIRFKCDWKRKLFSTNYNLVTEMIVTGRSESDVQKIHHREAFGDKEIFEDRISLFQDQDFWKQYNIIEPTESLETAIKKIVKQSK